MLAQLATRAPGLPAVAEDDRLWHRAFWACWLHDLGKSASGFQRVLRGETQTWGQRHEVLSLAFLPWVAASDSEDYAWIAAGIVSHHRDADVILEQLYDVGRSVEAETLAGLDEMVAELDDATVDALIRFVVETGPSWLATSTLRERGVREPSGVPPEREGFRAVAARWILDALRSYDRLHRRLQTTRDDAGGRRQAMLLRGLVQLSDHLGSAHAGALSPLIIPEPAELFRHAGIAGGEDGVRSHQRGAQQRIGSLVLAAPTGSGKTEAALLWAGRQLAEPVRSRRLVYLLPYQASLNAMHARLGTSLQADVGLVHGKGTQALYRTLVEQAYRRNVAAAKASAANNLARMHHPAVWVGTPYQLLRGAYRLPGYEQVWTALAGSQIVMDEPHAYEPERLGLILGMLAELVRGWGVRVCAMTATLPTWTRRLLEEAIGARSLAIDRALFAQHRRHRLAVVAGDLLDDEVLRRVAECARGGASVLVAANTIARAQQAFAQVAWRLGTEHVRLLHSRFIARDRLAKEQEIVGLLDAGGQQSNDAGLVVVATQVIEVSLDLDFDTIFSEPAPLEALAQRFGRVNRRGKKGDGGIVPVHVLDRPRDGHGIYNTDLVERTLAWLAGADGQIIDEAGLGDALDAIYGDDLAEAFGWRVTAARRGFEAACIRDLHAFASDEALVDQFDKLFDGTEALPACFVDEYQRMCELEPLDAHGLLVPLSDRQYRHLRNRRRWDPQLKQRIVDVPYDPSQGLLLPGRSAPA